MTSPWCSPMSCRPEPWGLAASEFRPCPCSEHPPLSVAPMMRAAWSRLKRRGEHFRCLLQLRRVHGSPNDASYCRAVRWTGCLRTVSACAVAVTSGSEPARKRASDLFFLPGGIRMIFESAQPNPPHRRPSSLGAGRSLAEVRRGGLGDGDLLCYGCRLTRGSLLWHSWTRGSHVIHTPRSHEHRLQRSRSAPAAPRSECVRVREEGGHPRRWSTASSHHPQVALVDCVRLAVTGSLCREGSLFSRGGRRTDRCAEQETCDS